ncbi:serine/threonine protein kinase [Streptomyces eurocidicus]|uniref:non-specific serine/threonine protein kinase n=2 Tax=Streptomyces eurocidicus TaxID=66423 RepID=A0A2N8NYB2_STREU|nr:serine/threonine protein kinase [Streptomyces eurocidicus]PNE33770.1 serine/threonine protein kinase [Streptomyces eurocidicus]
MPDVPEMWGNGGLVGDGRYRLTHRLGRGGMAEVFAAEDVRLGRTVAVKLLRADLAEDPVSKARFTREAQSVAGLNHHAVVAVYDSGEDTVGRNVVPYIVMELVEGRTIRDLLLGAEPPPPDQALIIVSGVLEALAYSHQHGIVHRDIKPANVIITNNGAVKVMDFGIARALHGAASTMTQTGMVMGTPQYLSPEQALGKTVDARSDLYATGCLLYELLALRPPFTGETPLSVVYQHVQDTPVPPSQVLGSLPPELDGLVMRSLAKDPDDRFQSAEEMRGLVQYALQMLHDAGAHSGSWDTGPVAHATAATQALGMGGMGGMAGTTAMPHPVHGDTSQQPIIPPRGGDDGGFDGYGGRGRGGGGGGKGKMVLVAVIALIAVVAGVAFAVKTMNKPDDKRTTDRPKTSVSSSSSPNPSSSPETSGKPSRPATQPGGGTTGEQESDSSTSGGGQEPDGDTGSHHSSKPSNKPSPDPSTPVTPTGEPSTKPSGDDKPPTGGTSAGQDGGSANAGTSAGQVGGPGATINGQGTGTTPGG